MKRRTITLVSWLLLWSACLVPPPPMAPDAQRPPQRSESAAAPGAGRVALIDELSIRISSQDRRAEVRVSGTPLGVQIFSREGDLVRSSAGGRAPSFEVEPKPGNEGLGLAGRLYPGSLLIEPHGAHGLRVTNLVQLEDYLQGVVPAELVLWSAEREEIAAQAIAARTYALRSYAERRATSQNAFLWDDTRDQVYAGRFSAGTSSGARRVQARLESALAATRGMLLVDSAGALFDVRFHATCGGHTTQGVDALPSESRVRGGAVACPPCAAIGADERARAADKSLKRRVHWTWTASRAELDQLATDLGLGRQLRKLRPLSSDGHGRWLSVELVGDARKKTIDLTRLRSQLDPARLKSGHILRTWPANGEPGQGGLMFEGLGRGHGTGLCQIGSHEFAKQGWSARRILTYYLEGATLTRRGDARLARQP